VNCCVSPLAMLGAAGVTAIETNVAGVTVSIVPPDTVPSVAVIVVVPGAMLLARPLVPVALLIVATAVLEDDHVTCVVRSCVVVSV
jgi:hypothetical protein